MKPVITAQTMRRCEEINFAAGSADALELMYIAGRGCFEIFRKFMAAHGFFRRVVIFAGSGNNGGDGVVIADFFARQEKYEVVLALASEKNKLSSAGTFYLAKLSEKVTVCSADDVELQNGDCIVEALLGTGCRAPMREPYRSLIGRINAAALPVLSVDLPAGLGSDVCVKAELTAVIGYFKDTLFTAGGIENTGALRLVDLPLPILPETAPETPESSSLQWFRKSTAVLPRNVHKYQRGAVLVAGGSKSYVQAPFLTARSALRSGAGLVKLAVPFKVAPGSGCLGVIPLQTADKDGFFCRESLNKELFSKVNAIAAGPGMGRSSSVTDAVEELLKSDLPLVLDADALFAAGKLPWLLHKRSAATILTPHRGEANILANNLKVELTGDNIDDARKLACAANAVILLKGARTVVASPEGRCIINTTGSSALATAGSGDTLTGIIAAELAAMHSAGAIDAAAAAARGAFLHGIAGELGALQWGSRGMIADDLPELIARAENIIAKKGDIF